MGKIGDFKSLRRKGDLFWGVDPPPAPLKKATVYTQVESELVAIRAEWTQTVAARVLK
jgi:hypothetical protein